MATRSRKTSGSRKSSRANPSDLNGMLDTLSTLSEGEGDIAVADIHKEIGQRSFGPALLVVGLIMATLAMIPLLPTACAVSVLLIAGQLLIGRHRIWLPQVILKRHLPKEKFRKALKAARPTARVIDRMIRPRQAWLTERPAVYAVAGVCAATAVPTPVLELVPFASHVPGIAFSMFGLALTAHDGLLALFAFVVSAGTLYILAAHFGLGF